MQSNCSMSLLYSLVNYVCSDIAQEGNLLCLNAHEKDVTMKYHYTMEAVD